MSISLLCYIFHYKVDIPLSETNVVDVLSGRIDRTLVTVRLLDRS